MTAQLAPLPVQKFFSNNGTPLANGFLYSYAAGTTTPTATFVDSTQTTQNTNPILLNARGECALWLNPLQSYKFLLTDSAGNTIPGWPVDNINGPLFPNSSIIPSLDNTFYLGSTSLAWADAYLGPNHVSVLTAIQGIRTAQEIAATVTPTNFAYPPGNIIRYGADPLGVVDSTTALQNAVLVASQNLGPPVYIPAGKYKITATTTIAAGKQVNIRGDGKFLSILYATGFSSDTPVLNYNGASGVGQRIDAIHASDFAIWSDNNLARGITASWVINSRFDNLYFYQLYRGWVGTSSFGNGFRNNNAFLITQDCYLFNTACNNNFFEKTRFVGTNGINVIAQCDTLTIIGCDFEGIIGNGAGVTLVPATGTIVYDVTIIGCHFENVNGTAIFADGVDANSVHGLVIKNNYITGGFTQYSNTNAINAIELIHVKGFEVTNNEFQDWQTQALFLNATTANAVNGEVINNTSSANTVTNLSDVALDGSIRIANNWTAAISAGGNNVRNSINYTAGGVVTVAYSATMAIDTTLGQFYVITANNNSGFTISNPTGGFNITGATKVITITIHNTSGGALGSATWSSAYKISSWTNPGNGFSRSITFYYDGTNWQQFNTTANDVAN